MPKIKVQKKKNIDVFDKGLLHYLLKIKGRATTNRIAKRSKMSWNTADKHLKKLKRMGLVKSEREKKKNFWKVNRNFSGTTQTREKLPKRNHGKIK